MQRILCMCMCISCRCRFMMFRKIIKIPNLILTIGLTNYLPWLSLNWSVRWFAFVHRSTCTFCCIPSHASVGEMSEGEMSRGKIPFPDVLVWSTKLVDGRPRVLHTTVERVAAECTMHAANHSRSLALSLFGLSDTTFFPRFSKIIRRLIFNLSWDKQAISRKCEFFILCVYLVTSVSMTPLISHQDI